MRNFSTLACKVCTFVTLVAIFAGSAFSQLKLRTALDTDGDGKADLSIFRPSDHNWYVLKSNGGVVVQNWGSPNEDFPTPGDYDHDGKGDISVWRDTTGFWYTINSSDSTVSAVQWGTSGDEPVARDYDGDGITDFAVVRRTNGNMIWYVLKSTGGVDATQWGISTDFTAPGDYDGDGKFDYTVQRPGATATSQATFWVLKSSGGFIQFDWGISSDLAVPGDYDGDGTTDFAVVREEPANNNNLVWYIFRSQSSTGVGIPFGAIGDDLTVQNDYDGDGKTDIAVWRNSDGNFYIINSSGGFTVTHWGTANDFPVAGYDTH
jgi:hypothetical protein